ncbi:probable pectinesterase/pectinesterase inhibitor 12 [Dendrobium catenatum]|uniref:Pectinesterase n=1 Tax=Dendrobium catenatum TaxID=906689 RepID=A0A2I0W1D7_9ASPA|nr:probable pectinesterase/pectinesterase inhibitor 12 [Dendrobium catenatum]PKU69474.1 putative pectinesterase/pectinesterase inhibitor 12 [Dendrobium catenatum]
MATLCFLLLISILLVLVHNCSSSSDLVLTVAADGSGNFTTIREAIEFAPSRSSDRIRIMVSSGVYEENLVVPPEKVKISLIGQGSRRTIITGNRSLDGGWTTMTSATLAVEGAGFAASDLTIQNTAGPSNGQAVALRVESDHSVFYRCIIDGNQDTLYARAARQFYRECDIRGTVDFIFGDATALFQNSVIQPKGLKGGTITAQARDHRSSSTGFSFDRCVIEPFSDDVPAGSFYLGRPWRSYARVVFVRSYMEDVINPAGWVAWDGAGKEVPETIFYGEFENEGAGAAKKGRVQWKGVRRLGRGEAAGFSVADFIQGDLWIPATGVPFDPQI